MNRRKLFFVFVIFYVAMLVVTACGRSNDNEVDNTSVDVNDSDNYIPNPVPPVDEAINIDNYENVLELVVVAESRERGFIRQAEQRMNEARAARGEPLVSVVTNDYNLSSGWDVVSVFNARLGVELMAGGGPDLIVTNMLMITDWVRSGLFMDFYGIIEQCPNTRLEDFYTNVLEAMACGDGLHVFPLSFGFEHVAINLNMPPSVIERFISFDEISVGDILAIYADLRANYPAHISGLLLGNKFSLVPPSGMFSYTKLSFIDFNNRVSHLTDERFVSFLQTFQQLFNLQSGLYSGSIGTVWPLVNDYMARQLSNKYIFMIESDGLGPINALFTPVNPYFSHFVPLVNELGQLRIENFLGGATWTNGLIPIAANDPMLSWEFLMHLLYVMDAQNTQRREIGRHSISTPIKRALFEARTRPIIEHTIDNYAQRFVGMDNAVSRELQLDAAVNRLAYLNEREIYAPPLFHASLATWDIFYSLLAGVITPEDAALQMHNITTLQFMEW